MSFETCFAEIRKNNFEQEWGLEEDEMRIHATNVDYIQKNAKNKVEADSRIKNYFDKEAQKVRELSSTKIMTMEKALDGFSAMKSSLEEDKGVKILGKARLKRSVFETYKDLIRGGSAKLGHGMNRAVDDIADGFKAEVLGRFQQITKKYLRVMESGKIDEQIAVAKHALENELPMPKEVSKEALEIATEMHTGQETLVRHKKAYNPEFKEASNYIVPESHNREAIAKDPFKEWYKLAKPAFFNRSFGDIPEANKEEIFKAFYSMFSAGRSGYAALGDYLSRDLMKLIKSHRELLISDPEAFVAYNRKYGKGTLFKAYVDHVNSVATTLALADKFGSDVHAFHTEILGMVKEHYPEDYAILTTKTNKNTINTLYDVATGQSNMPAVTPTGRLASGLMMFKHVTSNGMAWLSSLTDLAMLPARITTVNGKSYASNAVSTVSGYLSNFVKNAADREELLKSNFIVLEGMSRELQMLLSGSREGVGSKVSRVFTKLTLLERHIESIKATTVQMLAKDMAEMSDKPFDSLPVHIQKGLQRYGIGKFEMEAMRLARENVDEFSDEAKNLKLEFITGNAIMSLNDATMTKYLNDSGKARVGEITAERLDRARIELKNNLAALYNAHADAGSSTPNLKLNAMMFGGSDINTAKGAIWRMMMQFKSAAVTSLENYKYLYFSGKDVGHGNYALIGKTLALSMFYSTMATWTKDALMGKTPKDPTEPKFLLRSAASAGIGGFFLDVVANEVEKETTLGTAGRIALAFAGPVPSAALELASAPIDLSKGLFNPEIRGGRRFEEDLLTWTLRNVPAQNLWLWKAIFAQAVANPMRDWIDPGTTARMERTTRKQPGLGDGKQGYFVDFARPTQHVDWGELIK